MQTINLPTDSADYHLLTKGIELSKGAEGMTCEIGLRAGGGTKVILDALHEHAPEKIHLAIDPYGNILYEHKQGEFVRLDYTNEMKMECLHNLYQYCMTLQQEFIFFNMEDSEFFKRFADGVPVYNTEKQVLNKYSFVHFDAAHSINAVCDQILFFNSRSSKGTCFVFDDITGYYNHDFIERMLFKLGFTLIEKTYHKGLYQL